MNKRSLDVENTQDATDKINDIKVQGDPDVWRLICKASSASQDWMKSTKAMQLPNGVLIQVSTKEKEGVAEALQFVPGITLDMIIGCRHEK